MSEYEKTEKTSEQSRQDDDFEKLYKKLTSKNAKRASDAVFNATGEDLKKAFKSDDD